MTEQEIIKKHYRKLGRKGNKAVVDKYGKEQFKKWGHLGGRPKKAKVSEKIPV